jgi:hypothetical protein
MMDLSVNPTLLWQERVLNCHTVSTSVITARQVWRTHGHDDKIFLLIAFSWTELAVVGILDLRDPPPRP